MALGEEKYAEVSRFLQTSCATGVLVLPAIRQCMKLGTVLLAAYTNT